MLVGFKRMKIQPYMADGTPNGDVIVIEGKQDKGATTKFEISGMSVKATKVAGSDITYYISRKGVGDLAVALGILDMPEEASDRLLGFKTGDNKISYIGNDTEAPYCSVLMESSDGHGGKALFGFFKGVFSRDKVSADSLDPSEAYKPEADDWDFTAMASDKDDETNGQYVGKYVGSDEETITALTTQVLGDPKV